MNGNDDIKKEVSSVFIVKFNRKLIDWGINIVIRDKKLAIDYIKPDWTDCGNIQAWSPRWSTWDRIELKDITGDDPRYIVMVSQAVVDLIEDLEVLGELSGKIKYFNEI